MNESDKEAPKRYKCPLCNNWMKKQRIKGTSPVQWTEPVCWPCYFRTKAKAEAKQAEANIDAPIKTNVRIGKL